MGCDIHFFTEVRKNGKWESVDEWEEEDGWTHVERELYRGRNYNLFSILADVRNGYGFAGIDTGEPFNVIAAPRGVPESASDEYKNLVTQWGPDGHSHSWLTLQEILDFDWTQKTVNAGVLSARQFIEWDRWNRKQGDAPESWCGSISGGGVINVTGPELAEMCKPIIESNQGWLNNGMDEALVDAGLEYNTEHGPRAIYYAKFHWEIEYYKCTRFFWSDTIPQMLRLGKPEDVRAVFFFDN
jgi:hypothetical protein